MMARNVGDTLLTRGGRTRGAEVSDALEYLAQILHVQRRVRVVLPGRHLHLREQLRLGRCGLRREQQCAGPLSDRVEEHLGVLLSLPLRREHLLQDSDLDRRLRNSQRNPQVKARDAR